MSNSELFQLFRDLAGFIAGGIPVLLFVLQIVGLLRRNWKPISEAYKRNVLVPVTAGASNGHSNGAFQNVTSVAIGGLDAQLRGVDAKLTTLIGQVTHNTEQNDQRMKVVEFDLGVLKAQMGARMERETDILRRLQSLEDTKAA